MLWQDPGLNLALFKHRVGAHKTSLFQSEFCKNKAVTGCSSFLP